MILRRLVMVVIGVILICPRSSAQSTDYCKELATELLQNHDLVQTNFFNIVNSPSCFLEANKENYEAIAPARASLWNAFQSVSGSQQQGASVSSAAGTNAVSKPSGPTALVEEFGGVNTTTGTSSFTAQWAPGTLLTNLATSGVVPLCLEKNYPPGCISPKLLKDLAPLTLKITGNTSSGSSSVAGTATNPGSTASAQPVTVNSKGVSKPGFSGLTVQYSFWGSKAKAATTSLTKPLPADLLAKIKIEVEDANRFKNALGGCNAIPEWQDEQKNHPLEMASVERLQQQIADRYRQLLISMLNSESCKPAVQNLNNLFASILEAKATEDFADQQNAAKKPEFALEYDLNTPQNQPSYSTAKATLTISFGASKADSKAKALSGTNTKKGTKNWAEGNPAEAGGNAQSQEGPKPNTHSYAMKQASMVISPNASQMQRNAKPQAEANVKPWSLTVTGSGDFYHAEPDSTIPMASHLRDIQFGTELAYLFSPNDNSGAFRKFVGDITTAAAYSYQDQTSPAILNGPALSDFTGLPNSTTSAFAQRGLIHLGQIRLGFGSGTNLNFPLAFTYSNRTQFIVHPTWGLQFGISYNLTSLLSPSSAAKK